MQMYGLRTNARKPANRKRRINAQQSVVIVNLRIELLQSSGNVGRRLLHGVQLAVLGHGSCIVAVLVHESLQPLDLALTHMSDFLGRRVLCLFDKRAHDVGIGLVVDDAAPLGVVLVDFGVFVIRVEIVERVVERVIGV